MKSFFKKRHTHFIILNVLGIIIICMFCRLGFWQLNRALEKKMILMHYNHEHSKPIYYFNKDYKLPTNYQSLSVSGAIEPFILYLDNQFYQHVFGYHIIQPLKLKNGYYLLIDRGWISGEPARGKVPVVHTDINAHHFEGTVYFPSKPSFSLGHAIDSHNKKYAVIETQYLKQIESVLPKPYYPFILRLHDSSQGILQSNWKVISVSPNRHYGYAFQWFLFAFTLLIISLYLNIKYFRNLKK